jgi:hypothetical protein
MRGPRDRQRAGITPEIEIRGKASSRLPSDQMLKSRQRRELALSRSIPLVSRADINKMQPLSPDISA